MKKKLQIILIIIILLSISSCQPVKHIISIKNSTDINIYITFSGNENYYKSYPERKKLFSPNYIEDNFADEILKPKVSKQLIIFENHDVDINLLKKYIIKLEIKNSEMDIIKTIDDFSNEDLVTVQTSGFLKLKHRVSCLIIKNK